MRLDLVPDPVLTRYRLGLIIYHLKALAPERFYYGDYARSTSSTDPFWPSDLNACGTVGCAAGHATAIPELQALGLKLERGRPQLIGNPALHPIEVMAKLLGISENDAGFLFLPGSTRFGYGVFPIRSPDYNASLSAVIDHLTWYLNALPQVATHV